MPTTLTFVATITVDVDDPDEVLCPGANGPDGYEPVTVQSDMADEIRMGIYNSVWTTNGRNAHVEVKAAARV